MKICMLATSFPRHKEDFVGQWVLGLARALVDKGANVTVIAPHDHDTSDEDTWDGIQIRRFYYWLPKSSHGLCYGAGIPTNIRRKKWVALQFPTLEAGFLSAALRYGKDADVYNAHWTFAGLPTVWVSKLKRKPLVTTAYSAEYVNKALHPLNKYIVNNSSAVISISQFTKDTLEQVVKPRRHHVIGLGVNSEKIAPEDFNIAEFRAQQGIMTDEKLIFAVGRLVERKGYAVLIEAMTALINQGKPYRLLLAGQGPDRDLLQAQINASGMDAHIRLIGFVPDEQLKYYLKASDILVMPSIMDQSGDTEGLGLPLIEAMANGTPVVASRIGGILDIVEHEKTGLLTEPGNVSELASAIERVISEPTLAQHLVQEGYALVNSRFAWSNIADETLKVFEDAVRNNP